jgi:2-polyprenyl-3-methyl-5-hydroxy-6-metoxy-1,4-benzoquinol methylase
VIETWSEGISGEGMPDAALVEGLELVRAHPWWLARARLALSLLRAEGIAPPASLIDVGCGWGVNLQALEAAGYRVSGLDASREILKLIDGPRRTLVQADLTQPFPPTHERYEAGLMLDVLEHLDDDRGGLERVAQLIEPGGTLIVGVPALPELFSEFDEIQGHRRRYTDETLRAAFQGAGLTLKAVHWWGAWMVPTLKLMRLRKSSRTASPKSYSDYLHVPPWPAALVMRGLYAIEGFGPILKRLPIGTSLLAIATRD